MSATERSVAAGRTAERFGFFTDAVFAIAMTLLVIEIPRPTGNAFHVGQGVSKTQAFDRLWHFLVLEHNSFYAYLLAFSMLWIVWRQHHILLDQVSGLSSAMVGWHFPLLLLAAFLPYATTVMGHFHDNPMAALLLWAVVWGLLLSRSVIQTMASRDHVLLPDVDQAQYRESLVVSWIVVGYWTLTVALVWWTPWVEILWFLTVPVGTVARIVCRRAFGSAEPAAIEPAEH
jgi:uncharacterized membrane protein